MDNGKKRILIIEDDEEMRSLLKDWMQEEGFEVHSVHDGSEAFRKLAKEMFDLILTDVRMPGLRGLEILPGLKQLQPNAAIIVVTAFGSDDIQRRVLQRGAHAYLEKPIRWHELKALIRHLTLAE